MSRRRLPRYIVYVRHPQCLHNVALDEAVRSGIANRKSPLTKIGEQQCRIVVQYLKKTFGTFDAVFTSTYERTHAIPIMLQAGFKPSPLLDERNMGIWHLHERSNFQTEYAEEVQRLNEEGYYHYCAPQGESCVSVVGRTQEFLTHLAEYRGAERVLISGHGISGLCLRQVLFDDSVETWYTYERLKNASVSVYKLDGETCSCVQYNIAPWEGLLETTQGVEA